MPSDGKGGWILDEEEDAPHYSLRDAQRRERERAEARQKQNDTKATTKITSIFRRPKIKIP